MRMVRMLLIAIFLIAGFTASAQTISLSGTITDSSSQVWNSCSWSASIYSPSGAPMYGTTPVPANTFGGSCSSSGVLTSAGQFYNTTTITPKGALYTINVCSNTTAPCTTMLLPVTSNIQFFAAVNATLALPSVAAFVGTIAYADSEVVPTPLVGSRYWNSTLGQIRYWNGTAWVADGGIADITGGTIDGAVIGGTTPAAGTFTVLDVTGAAGTFRGYYADTAGVHRWSWGAGVQPENGSNSGSDFILNSYSDGGAGGVTAIDIARSTGQLILATRPVFGTYTPWDSGNLNFGAPPAIGGATPAAGAFTTLVANSLNSTPVGATTPASGSFTTAQIGGYYVCYLSTYFEFSSNNSGCNSNGALHLGFLAATGSITLNGLNILPSLTATTPSIGGSLLSIGCTNQATVIVASAATNMACVMTGVAGNPANIQPQCSVTSAGVVTPQLCTAVAVTPAAQTYNIRVIQ